MSPCSPNDEDFYDDEDWDDYDYEWDDEDEEEDDEED